MAWERRERGGRYYTRSRRVRGRVVREYVPVAIAHVCAEMEVLTAEDRAIEREIAAEERREERERWEAHAAAIFGPLDVLDAAADALLRRELEARGYHQHYRSEWRKRRHGS